MLNKLILFLAENPEIDPDRVRPGLLGLFAFLSLAAAVAVIAYFLNRSIKKTNEHFERENK